MHWRKQRSRHVAALVASAVGAYCLSTLSAAATLDAHQPGLQTASLPQVIAPDVTWASAPPNSTLLLAPGAVVMVTLDRTLTTQDNTIGDHFPVTVSEDVMADDAVVIPKGTKGVGEITFRTGNGGFGKAGILQIALRTLEMGDQHYRLDGRYREEGKNANDSAAAVMFIGGILAAAVKGKGCVIEQGRKLKAYTAEPIPYAPRRLAELRTPDAPPNPAGHPASNGRDAVTTAKIRTMPPASIQGNRRSQE